MTLPRAAKAVLLAAACAGVVSAEGPAPETKYLMFQVFIMGAPVYAVGAPNDVSKPAAMASKQEIASLVQDILDAVGSSGDRRFKLGFTPGLLALDHSDQDVRRLIRDSFAIAKEKNVAVAFHLDDSMFWGSRRDLSGDAANVEWRDWNKTPNTGRRVDWGPQPSRFAPQLCFNSPAVRRVVRLRARMIGKEIAQQTALLKKEGRAELFAGIIAGSETMIGQDFKTGDYLGYCALTNRGFSAAHPPKNLDRERESVVREFMELWAKELAAGGVDKDKIYGHIAFTPQGFTEVDRHGLSFTPGETAHFATSDVAFDPAYRPGFSTYPMPGTFFAIYKELGPRKFPPWASAEGTNVVPNGMAGEPTMESYLGRMFNHGAVFVNIYSWGIGGEAQRRKNMFRLATENDEAVAAYRKFLRGETLTEAPLGTFTIADLRARMNRIQKELPAWVRKTDRKDEWRPLMKKLSGAIDRKQLEEACRDADAVLALIDRN
jgi:hypothetical protein